ncbi:MAG: trypsin-like serine protease [Desulfobacterales bacterium]|nr:trypsin-like serine protease [Desulfobacterales bacterium]
MKKDTTLFKHIRLICITVIFIVGIISVVASGGGSSGGSADDREKTSDGKGEIQGTVFNDSDGDSVFDENETGVEGWTVFIDADQDGFLDTGETSTTTDSSGNYSFTALEFSSYSVAIVLQEEWVQTKSSPKTLTKTTPRIVGGQPAAQDVWPWMTALVESDIENAFYGQFCGGTLIEPGWVVTAAHCVAENSERSAYTASDIDVVLGRNNLTDSDGERIAVSQIIVHPDYVSSAGEINDIALLRLSSPSSQSAASLVTEQEVNLTSPGVEAVAIGWGLMEEETRDFPDALQQVSLPIVSNTVAQNAYSSIGITITDEMFCAGYSEGGKDTCQGDSGGPLVVHDAAGTGWLLAGVTSFGEGCARVGYYGVYARISSFAEWITQKISSYYKAITISGGYVYDDVDFGILQTSTSSDSTDDDETVFENISVPDTKNGNIESNESADYYVVVGVSAGQQITATLISSSFDTYLYLANGDGDLLDHNDDISDSNQNSQLTFTTSSDVTYVLVVTSYSEGKTGAYTLSTN